MSTDKVQDNTNINVEKQSREAHNIGYEWFLLAYGVGISLYFAWPKEPLYWLCLFVVLGACLGYYFLQRHWEYNRPKTSMAILLFVFCLAGFGRSALHTHAASAPILPDYERSYDIDGWIEKTGKAGPLQHFYIRVHEIRGLPAEKTPYRVRIRLKPRGFVTGDNIHIRAILTGPRAPALFGGYDPARAAYFKKIGGFGFAISRPETSMRGSLNPLGIQEGGARTISVLRAKLSKRIRERAPPKTAGLQAALLTGDRSAIPEGQEQSLRDAGLAHLLAISGLHMGLLAGGAYSFAALLFSLIGPLARRYDMRKCAAIIGALTAFAYLLMSGASVSTQRAFIMAVIVFAAILLNRRAVSLRSVALAATITLLMHPESLMNSGFQMSFAATAALVVVYRKWSMKREYRTGFHPFLRIKNTIVGVSVTSFVAGTATAGFAALHFHRFARLGFFANLFAMPVFTFIVMPAGFVSVLLIPFGLDGYGLKIMGLGLDFVLMVSDWISGQDAALVHIKGANAQIISLFGLGFTWLCVSVYENRVRAKYIGMALMSVACLMWFNLERADMRVSDSARVAFWDTGAVNVLRVDRKRGDGYGRSRFIERAGQVDTQLDTYIDTSALYDQQACILEIKNKIISIVNEPEGVMEACLNSDLIILTQRSAGLRARRICKAPILDAQSLARDGAQDIYFRKNEVVVRPANSKHRKQRPWGR